MVEGLAHIHSQGMIHRDLKPVNIFLDSRDQVKIGDFGLATTSNLALQQSQDVMRNASSAGGEVGSVGTGLVGTAMYVAPELVGNASKSIYNQKVDLYSLGIIFFEMCHPTFVTTTERIDILNKLRTSQIRIPPCISSQPDYTQHTQVSSIFECVHIQNE